jgi:hypothetical protein
MEHIQEGYTKTFAWGLTKWFAASWHPSLPSREGRLMGYLTEWQRVTSHNFCRKIALGIKSEISKICKEREVQNSGESCTSCSGYGNPTRKFMREVKESGGSLTSRHNLYSDYKRKHFIECIRYNLKNPRLQNGRYDVTYLLPKNWKSDFSDFNQRQLSLRKVG